MLPSFDHLISHRQVEEFGIERSIEVQLPHTFSTAMRSISLINAVPTPLRAADGRT
jgi:hypothetical protein